MRYIKLLLIIFNTISVLHINLYKSVTHPVNAVKNMQGPAEILGCNICTFPITYPL